VSSRTSDYRSFITSGYVDPILRLYDELERGPSNPPTDVQSSVWENGLSASSRLPWSNLLTSASLA